MREGKFGEGNSDTAQDFFLSDIHNLEKMMCKESGRLMLSQDYHVRTP